MDGVALGIVKKNWDKDHPGQLQVEYSLAEKGKGETKWIPVMTFYSGKNYGAYFLPELESKVVLAFLYGDKDCPIVLGCQMGFENTLQSDTAKDKNERKRLSTKGGYEILFDEKDNEQKFSFADKKKEHTIDIDSKEGTITVDAKTKMVLKIAGEEFITLEKGIVTMKGDVVVKAKNIQVETEETITLKGKNVSVEPEEDITLTGKNIKAEPEADISLKGKNLTADPEKNITLKGDKVSLSPGKNVEAEGMNIKLTPTQGIEMNAKQVKLEGTKLEMKAQATGSLESGGMLQVKGQMLKLN